MYDYCIYSYRDFWEKLRCSYGSAQCTAKVSMDADLDAIGRQIAEHLSEPLEHLALYNGADMNKYNNHTS